MRRMDGTRRALRLLGVTALVTAGLIVVPEPAAAFELTTDYPAVAVEAGQDVTFDLSVTSDRRERVELEVSQAPEGWDVSLQGGGFQVGGVYTDPEEPPAVELSVQVPSSAQQGAHTVAVRASSGSEVENLRLDLRVAEQVAGAFELATEFPRLRGASDATFRFDLTLTNNTAREATFNLVAQGPEGWKIQARPSTEQMATTAHVDPGSETTVQVEADPPDQAQAGEYPIALRANGEGTTLERELVAEVVGSFDLTLSTASERLNASGAAGDTTSVPLLLRNQGTAPVRGVNLSASPPTDWEVAFEPSSVGQLGPGEQAQVTARLTPAGDAVAGDYAVTLTASGQGTNATVDLRYAVETSSLFGFLGVAVIVLAVVVLLWVFRRYGRR